MRTIGPTLMRSDLFKYNWDFLHLRLDAIHRGYPKYAEHTERLHLDCRRVKSSSKLAFSQGFVLFINVLGYMTTVALLLELKHVWGLAGSG